MHVFAYVKVENYNYILELNVAETWPSLQKKKSRSLSF